MSTRIRVHICSGDMTPHPDNSDCPNNANHTPCPRGYGAWFEWAERMNETHTQHQCPDCGRWAIWTPEEKP